MKKKIVIVGAGPAGLTAAVELSKTKKFDITIIESDSQVGGISKTIEHNGNRIDIGGHRFFSKSDWVMNWWTEFLPIFSENNSLAFLKYQGKEKKIEVGNIKDSDNVMLVRNRISRIYFNKNFFSYPLKLNFGTLRRLGYINSFIFGLSYLYSLCFPIKNEKSLEDFFINRFGRKLYLQFFKDYTEKVWGEKCSNISAAWGAQRIKSLSIFKALVHYFKTLFVKKKLAEQTSLIEEFIYPKYGPGQMWEVVSKELKKNKVEILMNSTVIDINIANDHVHYVKTNSLNKIECDYLISTMPIKNLVNASRNYWSPDIYKIANGLQYRDFVTIGLLIDKKHLTKKLIDNWIYIQEPGVDVGRIQVFNNWSPYLVDNDKYIWLGLEYFCNESDSLWNMSDQSLTEYAIKELIFIELINEKKVSDSIVVRVPKAYPGYFGASYKKFETLQSKLDAVNNLFLIGRNGMHRYNNQDHSMLTAKEAANQIILEKPDKSKIWNINLDDGYHEEK